MSRSSAFRIRWRVDFEIPAKTSSCGPARERQGDPVTRRLDLLDRLEAGRLDGRRDRRRPRPAPRGRRRRRRCGPRRAPIPIAARRDPRRAPSRRDRTRPARQVRAATRQDRPRPGQRERPPRVVGDQEARRPAARPPMLGPGARLVDVTAGRIDGSGVPVGQLIGRRVANAQSAAPNAAAFNPRPERCGAQSAAPNAAALAPPDTPPRRLAQRTRAAWAVSYARRPTRAQDEVPGADVPDLAPPKPVLKWAIPPVARPHRS